MKYDRRRSKQYEGKQEPTHVNRSFIRVDEVAAPRCDTSPSVPEKNLRHISTKPVAPERIALSCEWKERCYSGHSDERDGKSQSR